MTRPKPDTSCQREWTSQRSGLSAERRQRVLLGKGCGSLSRRRYADRFSKKNGRGNPGRLVNGSGSHFLALHVAQWAQSVLASTQHFMPQDGVGLEAQQPLLPEPDGQQAPLLQAQPTAKADRQMVRANSLISFIMLFVMFLVQVTAPSRATRPGGKWG